MTLDEIIRMARDAGMAMGFTQGIAVMNHENLERFAALIAAHEREACAVAAEQVVPRHTECGNKIAAAIRARGEK